MSGLTRSPRPAIFTSRPTSSIVSELENRRGRKRREGRRLRPSALQTEDRWNLRQIRQRSRLDQLAATEAEDCSRLRTDRRQLRRWWAHLVDALRVCPHKHCSPGARSLASFLNGVPKPDPATFAGGRVFDPKRCRI